MALIETRKCDDGSPSFRVKVRRKGAPTQTKTFKRLTDAKRWATTIEAAIHEGKTLPSARSRKHTVGEAIDRYSAEILEGRPPHARNTKLLISTSN